MVDVEGCRILGDDSLLFRQIRSGEGRYRDPGM